jgi:hypothetical protein
MSESKQTIYKLRNTPEIRFTLDSDVIGPNNDGAVVRSKIRRNDGLQFRYEVCFTSEYCKTKPAFDAEAYLETGLSVMNSQLESQVYKDTRIRLEVNSGLPRTQVGCKLDWP